MYFLQNTLLYAISIQVALKGALGDLPHKTEIYSLKMA